MPRKKRNNTEEKLPAELISIETARTLTLTWAADNQINILFIDLVTPAVLNQKNFSVWFFFDTDERLKNYEADGTIQRLKDEYTAKLKELKCPGEYLQGVIFFCDTQENVDRYANMQPINIK